MQYGLIMLPYLPLCKYVLKKKARWENIHDVNDISRSTFQFMTARLPLTPAVRKSMNGEREGRQSNNHHFILIQQSIPSSPPLTPFKSRGAKVGG